ncbi:Narbonolide/10-deoxymethynolide synthase PikA2, modules 3 and 4 (plasmid) [Sphingobium sp. AntQ-1]|uniref:NADP-dependent oxidoreductase n=1 Tax=Sphingobium sp. AntQ-1 TaxID=2930091 RepID=UPI00234EDED9|nr:NADP-dependent oxidoreductase [Sphingobium sp. AntQ-1]WCP15959.1 Narbonolide/10-deoxymethynolide synthase PikA2, modules 3 and 4 [Sphingobium sp. AntQ-1]
MRSVQFNEYGEPEVLHLAEVAEPHAGPGQVRIAVHVAGVNPIDWRIRAGYMREFMPRPLPSGVGVDASGVIDQIGEGVSGVAIGDAIFGSGIDTTAEYAILTDWALKPSNLSFEEAAGFGTPVETATRILDLVSPAKGTTILVSGAAGGVGSALVQLAQQRGLKVIGTASAPKHDYLRSLGAVPTTYGPGLVERVGALAPDGISAAFDLVGSGDIPDLIQITGNAASVVSIVDFSAMQHGAHMSTARSADLGKLLAEAAALSEAGAFKIPVEKLFAPDEVAEAHKISQAGHVTGRLAIKIR